MERETRVQALIEPTIEDMGFEVVRVRVSGTVRPVLGSYGGTGRRIANDC